MGRLLLIVLIFIILVIVTITTSVHKRTESTGDLITEQMLEAQVKKISNYALMYGVQQVRKNNINFSTGDSTEIFTDFFVLDGAIDSIRYEEIKPDTIEITSYAYCKMGEKEQNHSGKTYLYFNPISIAPVGVVNAIETTGDVKLKGAATVDGTIKEYSSIDFETIFGYPKTKVKNMTSNYMLDPVNNATPIENVTWIELVDNSDFQITDNGYYGMGLLIVEGDMKISGGTFDGIIWVTENLYISGNPTINGAIFVEGVTDVQTTVITGTPLVSYDSDEATKTYTLGAGDAYQIIGWYE